uniref:Uncharacterized protein n=1 Tax=Coccidioides posadasii RMSCC 3488 TaxID=454284 RepID=A0A0J6I2S9_COCPO|nr:hypothetical protein CPAG_01978 [Coccidioides posadasii RMSCC 3488]
MHSSKPCELFNFFKNFQHGQSPHEENFVDLEIGGIQLSDVHLRFEIVLRSFLFTNGLVTSPENKCHPRKDEMKICSQRQRLGEGQRDDQEVMPRIFLHGIPASMKSLGIQKSNRPSQAGVGTGQSLDVWAARFWAPVG